MKSTIPQRSGLMAMTVFIALVATQPLVANQWYQLGPQPIGPGQGYSGRVAAIAVDPSVKSHWLIGAAQGGIWATADYGFTWTPMTDNQASLAMGAIAFAPGNYQLVYAGTGEANFSGDSFAGQGLLVSRDNGNTWQMLNSSFAQSSFSSIQVDTGSNTNHLTAATTRGIAGIVRAGTNIPPNAPSRGVFVSTTGGTSFTQVLTGEATDLKANPTNFNFQYAGLGEIYGAPTNGVYRTTNGWASSQRISGPWTGITDPTNMGRVALAIAPSNPNVLYVAIAYARNSIFGDLVGIWETTNAWAPSPVWIPLADIDNGPYLWYSFVLAVDPNDVNTLYYGGINVFRHTFPADTWVSLAGSTHPDNHAIAWLPGFDATSYQMLLGNDGGIWLSSYPINTSWSDLNSGLCISQMYKGAVNPDHSSSLALAGMQDNGTALNPGMLEWNPVYGGDGCDCAISSANPSSNWAFETETLGIVELYRTTDGGKSINYAANGIDSTYAGFFVHFEKAPYNDDLFIAGTAQLWRCDNFFSGTQPEWVTNSPLMVDATGVPVSLSAMAFAPSDTSGTIYAFGTEIGQLQITTSGGTGWQNLNPGGVVPGRLVTGLAFSPASANTLYVTLSGFNASTPGHSGHLFKTTNALAASPVWTDVSPPVDLPNDCLAIDPLNQSNVYVGTDTGVWFSSNGGGTWTHYGPSSGMPNVAVFDLRMDSLGQPTAFTHGRGAFTFKPGIPIINIAFENGIARVPKGCLVCPPEYWLNPGDYEQLEVPLQGTLPIDTVNLIATIDPASPVTPMNGSQTYGALKGLGAPVSRTFQFVVNGGAAGGPGAPGPAGSCGSTGQLLIDLADGGVSLGQVSIPFRIGVPNYLVAEDFENLPPGTVLPPGWTTGSSGNDLPWMVGTNEPPNAPSPDAPDPDSPEDLPPPPGPPEFKVFTQLTGAPGDSFVTTPVFIPTTSSAQLQFRQDYLNSKQLDGGVLEIGTPSSGFQDILRAGGSFVQNGYNVTLAAVNPLGSRPAWSGDSGGWLPVIVNLPASAAGQPVQLRWHVGTTSSVTNGGWYVQAVLVNEPQCLPPVTNPVILNPALHGTNFTFQINTVSSRYFYVEYKTNLNDTAWQPLVTLTGNGQIQTVTNNVAGASQVYYRFHVQ